MKIDQSLAQLFTDREDEVRLFESYVSAKELPKPLIVIHGIGGVGKSSLLQMFDLHCKRNTIPAAIASGDQSISALEIIMQWEVGLKANGIDLPLLSSSLDSYRVIQAKIEDQIKNNELAIDDTNKVDLKLVKGILWNPTTMADSEIVLKWLTGFLSKPDIDLVTNPKIKLSADFLKDIERVADKKRIVLMIDTFEQVTAQGNWLTNLVQNTCSNVLFVVSGRGIPGWQNIWPDWMRYAQVIELKPLADDVTRELIHKHYLYLGGYNPDPEQVEAIIHFAHGLPLVVTSAVQLWIKYGVEDPRAVRTEPVADLVKLLIEGVSDQLRPALEAAAVLRWFDQPLLRIVLEQKDVRDIFEELRRFPFVSARPNGLAMHDVVRTAIEENLRMLDSRRHAELHKRAAIYFEKRYLEKNNRNETEQLGLEILYHLARADEETGIKLFQEMVKDLVVQNRNDQLKILLADVASYLHIPPEIVAAYDDPQKILSYSLDLTSKRKKTTKETKLLVVGQGSVGKTSLVKRLLSENFDPSENKTDGIAIEYWNIEIDDRAGTRKSQIQLNIWDFGGQEIMHATHQFFLTKRSIYVLVLDSRLTQEENRVEYWLKIIQSFSDDSPVLIVGNKIDQHLLDIDRTGLQKKYLNIVGILETSAATGVGIEALQIAITEQVNNLPHVHNLLPETWFAVKTKLEKLGRESNFITHDKYLELCAENEVSDETSQRTLIGFLHDLGVVLHFQDDPRLEALGILNPQWVTNGVYKILNSHTLFQNKGVLTVSMLDEILNLPEYPRGKRLFIVDMMKKFELCYDIPYGYDVESDKTFLVPDLLPKDQPDLKFNGVPAFEYAYPVLPSSVITRFIVRMNQKIDDGFVWRTGVVLKIGENTALIKADIEDRKITIAIEGLEHTRRDALSAIRFQLDEIHNSIKGLNPEKRVPIPEAPNAEAIEYDYLLMLEREGQETHLVKDGTRLVKVNVRQVLSAIETENQRKEQGGNVTHIYVGGNFDGNLTVGDGNQSIKDSYNKITIAKIDPELKQTLQQLVEAVETMNKSLPEEQVIETTEDLGKLVDEATKSKPNKKWYSVSIEGLIKAAENLDKLGAPVISLSRKVLSLLTGGAVKG